MKAKILAVVAISLFSLTALAATGAACCKPGSACCTPSASCCPSNQTSSQTSSSQCDCCNHK